MDDETRTFLSGAYRYLEQQQKTLQQVMIVTFALQKTVRELGPEAEKLYAKHYTAESQGPIKTEIDEALKLLAQSLRQLSRVN